MEGSRLDYTLTIIDTPGFEAIAAQGIERYKHITKQIKDFLLIEGKHGINQLHGIGFVTHAILARLTSPQKNIFDCVLAMFGKNMASNIFMLRTFTDATVSPVLGAMSAVNITFRDWCKFDNSGSTIIFAQPAERPSFDEMSWELSFKSFFTELGKAEPPSLQLTRQVLQERDQLECIVHGIQPLIMVGLKKIDEIRQKELVLKQMQAEIETNKDYTYQINITKLKKVDLPSGEFVMNCVRCNFICHTSCLIARDEDKHRCEAIDGGGPNNAKCRICPGRCGWKYHAVTCEQ